MPIFFVYNTGLNKEVINKIQNHQYSNDELKYIYEEILKTNKKRNQGLKIAMISLGVCFLMMAISFFYKMIKYSSSGISMKFVSPLFILAIPCLLLVLLYAKYNLVEKSKRQFMNALKQGYPELTKQFENIK